MGSSQNSPSRFLSGINGVCSPYSGVTVPAYTGFSIKCLARLRLIILRFIESIILIKYKSNTHMGIFDNRYR